MKAIEKTFTVNLTESEAKTIADALNAFYQSKRGSSFDADIIQAQGARVLRNGFGNLVGCSWCGKDA